MYYKQWKNQEVDKVFHLSLINHSAILPVKDGSAVIRMACHPRPYYSFLHDFSDQHVTPGSKPARLSYICSVVFELKVHLEFRCLISV